MNETIENLAFDHDDLFMDLSVHCRAYKGAETKRGLIQFTITTILYVALISGMIIGHILQIEWLVLFLMLPTAGLLVRLFTIQHDCGHGSFFKSREANDAIGRIISLLTVTPYDAWKRAHNMHHAASGNLDHRGVGAIDMLTVREYCTLAWSRRLAYRLYRNPFVMVILGTPVYVIFIQRIPFMVMTPFYESYRAVPAAKIWRSIGFLNIAIAFFYGGIAWLIGWQILTAVFLPVLILSSWIGGWLFFVQHQFENTYWQPSEKWEFRQAALAGSSYYVLPRILQWFTGNIGLHHIHHLCSAIPNYRLQKCLDENNYLQQMNRMTIWSSLKCIRYSLWDEDRQKMISFRQLKKI